MKSSSLTEATVTKYEKSADLIGPDDANQNIAEVLAEYILTHCSSLARYISSEQYGIWRGTPRTNLPYFVANPASGERKSNNAPNHYTILMDSSPYFSDYPKRSKSLICSTYEERAVSYARQMHERTFLMVPHDGVVVGMCPDEDIWDTTINVSWLGDREEMRGQYSRGKLEFADLAESLKDFGFPNNNPSAMISYSKTDFFKKMFDNNFPEAKVKAGDFIEKIIEEMQPLRTGFKLTTAMSLYASAPILNKEVWFSGKCLAISMPLVQAVTEELNIRLRK